MNVATVGAELRWHKQFAPQGTNVNFAQILANGKIKVRTYERGVEDESGACGTGAVACAVVGVECFKLSLPVRVRTFLGFDLTIDGEWRGNQCVNPTLTGPAQVVYRGTIDLETLMTEG